jgi:hypothetical protein
MFWSVSQNIASRNDDDVAQNKEQHTQKKRTRIKKHSNATSQNQTEL